MIRRLAVLACLGFLAGCAQGLVPPAAPAEQAPAADPLAPAYVDIDDHPEQTAKAVSAPQDGDGGAAGPEPEKLEPPEPLAGPEPGAAPADPAPEPVAVRPDPNAAARARCVAGKGQFTRTATGAFVCVKRTRDANKACTAASQCEGACLARSGTCAPINPLIGCNDIVTQNGGTATVCID